MGKYVFLLHFTLVVLALDIAVAQPAIRIAFDFTGNDPARSLPWTNTSTRATGWSTTGWTIGTGLSLVSARSNRLAFAANSSSEANTLQQAITSQQYLAVGIASPNLAGHRVTFTIRRESWHAPLRYAVRSSMDSYSADLFVSELLSNANDATNTFTFLLPAAGWSNLTAPVQFRIIPYAARYNGHAASLTAFQIETAAPARTLTLNSTPGGSAVIEPARTLFEEGETAALRATPSAGYKFTGWAGAISGRGNPRSVAVATDMSATAIFDRKAHPRMEIGGNLEAVTYWTEAWIFKNLFSMARPWLSRPTTGDFVWDSGQIPPTDANGWPSVVPFAGANGTLHIAHTLMPLYMSGVHLVRFQGSGSIDLLPPGGGRITLNGTGGLFQRNLTFNTVPGDERLFLQIQQSAANDPIRNIEIISPGENPDLVANPFHSALITSLAPYRVLRFMDWLRTNGNTLERWNSRTTPTTYVQAGNEGVAHEYIIQLSNLTLKHPWICIPHRADDDYVRRTARLYRDSLHPDLVLYVEYSNETWNSMGDFTQTPYVAQQAVGLGITADQFVARRSAEIFRIFAEEYGAAMKHRYVNVIATQAGALDGVTRPRIVAFNNPAVNPGAHFPDALAIAPYFGVNYRPGDPVPTAEQMATSLSTASIQQGIGMAVSHKQIADEQGLRLVCYEGGQHFTGIFGAENDPNLIAEIHAANRDPRMGDRYAEYLAGLEMAGVDLFANFTHVGGWSKYGAWGLLERQEQPTNEAPKWRALNNWVGTLGNRKPALRISAGTGSTWLLQADLRPDRSYTLKTSTNLIDWTAVEEYTDLRGDDVTIELLQQAGNTDRLFWRIEE